MGDAAHTAHFTTGLATRAAMLDAATPAAALHERQDRDDALVAYVAARKPAARGGPAGCRRHGLLAGRCGRHLHFVSLVCGR